MSKPIDTLMQEHRVIEEVLDALESFEKGIDQGTDEDRKVAGQFATFFREFADRCHHGKEEDILFKELVEQGMPKETGPIGVMLEEHEMGRSCVRRIRALADAEGPWTADELQDFRGAVSDFVPLLRAHIQKEDGILFPHAEGLINPEQIDDLTKRFEQFECHGMGVGVHEKMLALAKELAKQSQN